MRLLCTSCVGLLMIALVFGYSTDNCGYNGRHWYRAMGWCAHKGSELLVGDFNGDGQSDIMCHDYPNGRIWVSLANEKGEFITTTWHDARLGWCGHAGSKLFIGDFNGDGRSDILCHDNTGKKWIKYANKLGQFPDAHWYKAMGWCYHAGSQLFIGDFNGDKRDDLLCHDKAGYKWIALANTKGQFTGTSWHKGMGWCYHAGSRLYIGDFNGDKRSDMMCSDHNGYKWIAYGKGNGYFTGTDWHANLKWCSEKHAFLRIADVNGDGKDDMICHQKSGGHTWVAYALPQNGFTNQYSYHRGGWCGLGPEGFFAGYFDKDSRADIMCHDTTHGKKWILYSQCPFVKRR